jgi:hypothetical protein
MRFYSCDSNRTSTRSDRIQDLPRQGKEQPLAWRRHTTSRRRGATARRGKLGCTAATFTRARVHGGIQMLGAYACEASEEKGPKGRGFTPCPVTHGGSTMAVLGSAHSKAGSDPPFMRSSGFTTTTAPRGRLPASCSSTPSSLTSLAADWGGETLVG